MSYNHRKQGSRSDNTVEHDLFASWEPVVDVNNVEDNNFIRNETDQLLSNNEFVFDLVNADRRNQCESSDCKSEMWLDPCKFSGRVIRRSENRDVECVSASVVLDDRTENINNDNNHGIVTRKITVLPPSVGYRGFCNVSDLSDSQRQPWKRLKSETKAHLKENTVKEYSDSDGKKIKMMRLSYEDPPKKIKKVQSCNTDTSNVKNSPEIEGFESLKRLELPSRKTIKSLKNSSPEHSDRSVKLALDQEVVTSSQLDGSYEEDSHSNIPGKLVKRQLVVNDKKSVKKDLPQNSKRGAFLNSVKNDQSSIRAPPVKRYKQPEIRKKRDTVLNRSDKTTKALCTNTEDNKQDDDDNLNEAATAEPGDIFKDLESVKAKLALLSSEVGKGDKENIEINCEGDKRETATEPQPSESQLLVTPSQLKRQAVSSGSLKKQEQVDNTEFAEYKMSESADNTKRKVCERNNIDRKAAKEFIRMKKAQYKEQQAKEQERKRMEIENKQLKLQQLQQTRVKLLKKSIKKKSVADEKPNWKGPIHESSSPPPLPAKATTSLAEQVMMSRKKSPKKNRPVISNRSCDIIVNHDAEESQRNLKTNILTEVEKNCLNVEEELKQIHDIGESDNALVDRLSQDCISGKLGQVDLSIIPENTCEDDKLSGRFSAESRLSILDESKDANKFVEAMNAEMKHLLKEFKLIREKSFQNEKKRNERNCKMVTEMDKIDVQSVQSSNTGIKNSAVGSAHAVRGGKLGGGDHVENSDDHPQSTTRDKSLSGGPLNDLADFELPFDRTNVKRKEVKKLLPAYENKSQLKNNTIAFSSSKNDTNLNHKENKIIANFKFLNDKSNEPKWLKAFESQPNPFNFITVVESKIKMAALQDNEHLKQFELQNKTENFVSSNHDRNVNGNQDSFIRPSKYLNDPKNEPKWLQAFASNPYPFNFITSVNNKLNQVGEQNDIGLLKQTDFMNDGHLLVPEQQQDNSYLQRQMLELSDFDEPKLVDRTSQSEDTDAPSLVSMVEDNFESENILPLVIEDLKLNLPLSLNSDVSSVKESSATSQDQLLEEVYYKGYGSFFKSKSDSLLDTKNKIKKSSVLPLHVPESVQSLTLLPISDICPSEERLRLPKSSKVSSETFSEKLLKSSQTFSVPNTDLIFQSSSSIASSAVQTGRDNILDNKCILKNYGSDSNPPLEFEEPCYYGGERRKKIKLSNLQEDNNQNNEQFEIGNVFSPDALFLQFKAELSKLEVFEASLAQVAATEHLRNLAINSNFNPLSLPQESNIHEDKSESHVGETKMETRILYEHYNEPTVVTDQPKQTEDKGVLDQVEVDEVDNTNKDEVQIMRVTSSEQVSQSSFSIATSRSSSTFQSVSESVSLRVASPVNEDNISVDKSKDLSGIVDLNLNSQSSSVSPNSVNRSTNFSNLRLSFTNQRSAAKYSLLIFDQLIKEQKLRLEQQLGAFKLRQKALRDRTKAEFTLLEIQRISLREKRLEEQAKNIKKKQRGLLLKWRQDHEELMRQRNNEELATQERIMMLLQQQNLIKMQLSTKNTLRKMKSAIATFATGESSLKKSVVSVGQPTSVRACGSMSSLAESSGNEHQSAVHQHQKQLHKSQSRTTGDGGNEDRASSSASDALVFKRNVSKHSKVYKGSTDGSDKTASSIDKHDSMKRKELQQQKSWPRMVLDRSTSPFQLTPVEPSLDRQVITNSVITLATSSGDPVLSVAENTSKVLSTLHSGQDHEITSISEDLARSKAGSRATSGSRSETASQIQEEITEEEVNDLTTLNLQILPSQYNSDHLESPLSPVTASSYRTKNESTSPTPSSPQQTKYSGISNRQCRVSIKGPLTPQLQVGSCKNRKRYSSGSDESIILSQNETFSEQSDLEVRLSTLHEQLRQRKLEAEKLRREQKRAQRERLKTKEQSLIKQIQAYDAYIEQVRKDLEQDMDTSAVPIMKPLIRQTRAALRKPENINKAPKQEKKPAVSDESVSEASSIETTIQSPGQGAKEVDTSIIHTESSVKEVSSVEINEQSDQKSESASEKWIDAANFFNDKTSDFDISLGESKEGKLVNVENQSVVSRKNYEDQINQFLSDKMELDQSSKICDENVLRKNCQTIQHKDDGFNLSSVNSNISPRSIISEQLGSDGSQQLIETEVSLDSGRSIKSIANEQDSLDKDISQRPKKDDAYDSDSISLKSIQSDDQHLDSVQEIISEYDKSASLKSVSDKNDKLDSSLISNKVPSVHSETSNVDTFDSNGETSANESSDTNVPSEKSINLLIDEKFPLPIIDSLDESFDGGVTRHESMTENIDLKENVSIHSSIVPSDKINENSNEVIHSSCVTPETISSEKAKHPELGFLDGSKINEDREMKTLIVERVGEEEEEFVNDELRDEDNLEGVTESDLKSASAYLKPEDSIEAKNVSVADESDTINSSEKLHCLTSDESFSNQDDDFSTGSKIDEVIKVFLTEKEKSIKIIDASDDKENNINCSSVINNYSNKSEEKCNTVVSEFDENEDCLLSSRKTNEDYYYNQKNKRVDRITDKILSDLLKDSLSFSGKIFSDEPSSKCSVQNTDIETPFITALKKDRERKVKSNIENIMDNVMKTSVKEATDNVLKIYERKVLQNKDKKRGPQEDSVDLNSPKIPDSSTLVLNNSVGALSPSNDETFIIYQSPSPDKDTSIEDIGDEKKLDVKRLWLNEEMGLGRTCKEAEELRLQQLQIEEEIQQLERASAGQIGYDDHIPSYYYLREIPNKPPPPYTPPGQASIPTSQQDVLAIVHTAIDYLYTAHSLGDDLSKIQPSKKLQTLDDSPRSVYKRFLFDLVHQLILEAIDSGQDENLLPWERTEYKRKCWIPKKTDEIIKLIVVNKVKVLFGFETRNIKENLIIRWSRKKRDKVDELLVRESQEEEQEWTDFSQDETAIKNKITVAIWDCLLLETGISLQNAYNNKISRIRCLLDM